MLSIINNNKGKKRNYSIMCIYTSTWLLLKLHKMTTCNKSDLIFEIFYNIYKI